MVALFFPSIDISAGTLILLFFLSFVLGVLIGLLMAIKAGQWKE